jgi:hypothetical protein
LYRPLGPRSVLSDVGNNNHLSLRAGSIRLSDADPKDGAVVGATKQFFLFGANAASAATPVHNGRAGRLIQNSS